MSDIRNPLEIQISQLSPLERAIMYWLTIEREAVSFQDLQADIVPAISAKALLESLTSLRRRSLIEKNDATHFFLQVIRLWDVASGQCLKTLQGDTHLVEAVAFSQNGQILLSGSDDHSVRLWDPQIGSCLKTLHGHRGPIRSLAFSQVEQVFASGGDDQTVCLWDLQTETCLKTLRGHTDRIWSVSFSPIEPLLASSGEDKTIRLWNIHTGQQTAIFTENTGWIWAISFSPDGKLLASGSEDKIVRIWNVQTHQCIATLAGHNAIVKSITFHLKEKLITSDWNLHLWDISTMNRVDIMSDHTDVIRCLAFCPAKNMLARSSQDGSIKIWDVTTGACLKTLRNEKLYERMDITGIKGLTETQKSEMKDLGAL